MSTSLERWYISIYINEKWTGRIGCYMSDLLAKIGNVPRPKLWIYICLYLYITRVVSNLAKCVPLNYSLFWNATRAIKVSPSISIFIYPTKLTCRIVNIDFYPYWYQHPNIFSLIPFYIYISTYNCQNYTSPRNSKLHFTQNPCNNLHHGHFK